MDIYFMRMIKKEIIKKAVGLKIRSFRERRGYSQESFADHINIDRKNYGAIERGERGISVLTLYRIAIGLEADMNEILPRHEEIAKLRNRNHSI